MLAWLGIVLGAVYLIYVGGGWWGIYSPYLRITTMVIAAITLGTWAFVAWRNPAWRPRTVMWPAIVAVLGSLTISTIFSRVPRVSLEYLGYTIVLVALYLMLVRLFADEFLRRRLVALATLLFVVTAGLYIGSVLFEWLHWWALVGGLGIPPLRPAYGGLTYNNPSAALTMAVLLAVPVAARVGSGSGRGISLIALIGAVIAFIALVSGSRSGWFALGLTAIIAAAVWLTAARNRAWLRERLLGMLATNRGRAAGAVVLVGVAAAVAIALPTVISRAQEAGGDLRLGYAVVAIRMFLESPLVGTGPGTWVIQRPGATDPALTDYYIPHAHNLEVQTLAELGVVGGVAGVIVLANLVWLLHRASRSGASRGRWWAWASGIGLLYFGLHQVLDFYVNMPAFLFAAAIPVAYLDATSNGGHQWFRAARSAVPRRYAGAAGLLVGLAIIPLLAQEVPAVLQAQGVAAANEGDWARAGRLSGMAASLDPDIGSYQLTAGLAAASTGDHEAAARHFERVAIRDDLPEAWLNLAAEQVELGKPDEALASLQAALRIGHQRPVVAMPAGDLALRLGDMDLAAFAFGWAIGRSPSLAADPWWTTDAVREAAYESAIGQAVERASPDRDWEIALMAGRGAFALDLLQARGQTAYARIARAWMGEPASIAELFADCEARPTALGAVEWCARLAAREGDAAAANRYREMANIVILGAYHAGAELRVSEAGMLGEQLLGEPADLWATYTYRRPGPWDILVPSLLDLKVE